MREGPDFASCEGGAPVRTYYELPLAETPAGVVVFLHGMGMHARSSRYSPMIEEWTRRGFAVVAWDCPHHGRSSRIGEGGHPLPPLRVSEPELVADAVSLVGMVKRRHPHSPLLLVGESLGGGLAMRIAPLVHPAAVCTIGGLVPTRATRARSAAVGAALGGVRMLRTAVQAPRRAVREAWRDPLVAKRLPPLSAARCHRDLVRRTAYSRIPCPVLAMVGERDRVYPPSATTKCLFACDGLPPLDRVCVVVEGATHDLVGGCERVVGETSALFFQWKMSSRC